MNTHTDEDVDLLVNDDIDVSLAPPTDYSFRKLRFLYELEGTRPRAMRLGKETTRGPEGKIITSSLWLNNNSLESMKFLTVFANTLFEAPNKLQWLDFSFNNLTEVGKEITKFHQLKILYLHGNCIANLSSLTRLKSLKQLRTLTLHGCPVETVPFYRQQVIALLPQLHKLDFGTITPKEANAPPPPGFVGDPDH